MPKLIIKDRSGAEHEVEGEGLTNLSLMEIVRDSGVDEIAALCGGCCSCSTCHVYVEPSFLPTLPPMSAEENDLLESSRHRTSSSRLSCQIRFTAKLSGMKVIIAPQD